MRTFVRDEKFLAHLKETEGGGHMLFTIISIPKGDYAVDQVWGALRLSHSCLRGTSSANELVFFGTQLGNREDMGVCLTVKDHVNNSLHKGGAVYVNR